MSKRRVVTAIIVLAAALSIIVLIKALRPKGTGEGEDPAPDVAVHVGKIVRATLHRFVTAYGTVEPEPPGDGRPAAGALISAPVGGILAEIPIPEGRPVAKGDILFRLDTRVAKVAVLKAENQLRFAETTFERQKQLLATDGTSLKTYQEAEQQLNAARDDLAAAKTDLALHEIAAPLSGTLVRLNARIGQAVDPSAVLAEVVALDRLVVSARVPSREAALLRPGQPVELESGSPDGGTVTFVGKDVDPGNDTVLVRISVPKGAGVQPGRFLSVRIVCEERRDRLAVPEASIVPGPGGGSLLMVLEGDRAVPKPVTAGLREGGLAEVEGEGLREGLVIVTEDAYSLTGETKVHVVGEK
jgi:membrane fusion protein (multidrug efflux system)